MTNENVSNSTLEKLKQVFSAEHIELVDNSWQHAGHVAMANHQGPLTGTHIHVCIVSSLFQGQTSVNRHRMVQKALKTEFAENLHALQINTYTPDEWATCKRT